MNTCTCSRRSVLAGGLIGLGATVLTSVTGGMRAYASTATGTGTLVVLSLRGGADGLSLVPPIGDPNYALARPDIAIPASQGIQLDSMFALHPGLAPLKKFWANGQLAVVHAAGSPDPTRSHFDAQRELERAAFANSEPTGWLDRYLSTLTGTLPPFTAIERGDLLPESLAGPAPAVAIGSLADFTLDVWSGDQPNYNNALKSMYAGVSHPVGNSAATTLSALGTAATLTSTAYVPANGATYGTDDTARSLQDVAQLIKAGVGLRVATVDMGNWDMHQNVGGPTGGWMHDQATALGNAIAAFVTDLGVLMGNVTIVTVSEFGRRVQQNDSGGLDHGHGQPMFVIGGGVKGGKVYGSWPTLAPGALDDGDLAATTDYRSVLSDVLAGPMGAGANDLSGIFPGWNSTGTGLFS